MKHKLDKFNEYIQIFADWAIVFIALIFGSIFFGGGLYYLFVNTQQWIVTMIENHFAAIILTPLMCLSSIMVVSILKLSNGPIKFKAFYLEFEGSSAPVMMWILVFLTQLTAVYLLW